MRGVLHYTSLSKIKRNGTENAIIYFHVYSTFVLGRFDLFCSFLIVLFKSLTADKHKQ